jgi:flagellar basal body-associated protein FliL
LLLAGAASLLLGGPALAAAAPEPGPPKPVFVPLGEFTINLHGRSEQFGFVVISVTLEVAPAAANPIKDIMPRLKEAIMRRLMVLADRGSLLPGQTDPLVLKTTLAETLGRLRNDGIHDVLITRLLYG